MLEIRKVLATYIPEQREVEIQNVTDGIAFVQPTSFDSAKDSPIYYHGWLTSVKNLRSVYVVRVDGTREFMGDPPVNKPASMVAEMVVYG
jgi:hypothetical protein